MKETAVRHQINCQHSQHLCFSKRHSCCVVLFLPRLLTVKSSVLRSIFCALIRRFPWKHLTNSILQENPAKFVETIYSYISLNSKLFRSKKRIMLKAVILVGGPQKGKNFNNKNLHASMQWTCKFVTLCRHTFSAIVTWFTETIVPDCRPFDYSTSYWGMRSGERAQRNSGHWLLSNDTNGEICQRHANDVQC